MRRAVKGAVKTALIIATGLVALSLGWIGIMIGLALFLLFIAASKTR